MNIMAGWIRPEMNWARKLDAYRRWLCCSKVSIASCWRPNTLTSEWPVNISSMWPLSLPVVDHWSTNCGCDRLPIRVVIQIDTGTVTSAMIASSGEIQNMNASTPMIVSTDVISWLNVCCSVWAMLSVSLVARLSTSPRGCWSK